MKLLRNIFIVLLLIVVLVAAGGFVVFNDITRGVLPQISGEIRLPILTDTVTIKRDAWGVPHIYASNTRDLLIAQGYTQAQDRWWQMEFFRATGDGRLQELTGQNDELMSNDLFIRTIGWRRSAERDVAEVYDAHTLELLGMFAEGVNAYIEGKSGGDLAFEYSLLGVRGINIPIRPWTVTDTVVWTKVMSWDLSDKLADRSRADDLAKLGEEMVAYLNPAYPFEHNPTILQAEDLPPLQPELLGSTTRLNTQTVTYDYGSDRMAGNLRPGTGFVFGEGEGIGSNNWVVSGELTESGKPLLANDPHLSLQMPSIWYEIGLHCRPVSEECPFDVQGFTFASFPGVVIGHNARVAWGFTNVGPDVMDLYQIRVNPDNPLQYEWDGDWRDMTVHDEVIRFGDSTETVTIQVRETHLGPIINDHQIADDGTLGGFNNENPLALRWAALDSSQTLRAIFLLDTAQNWEDFRAAAQYFDAPSQNLVYADVDGNIGYQTPGLIPIRPMGINPTLPIDGTTSANEWLGYIPYDLLPRVYNPESGFIHSANQALVPLEYYDWLKAQLADQYGTEINVVIGNDWDHGYRGKRIVELLTTGAPFNVGKFEEIQADNKFIPAEEIAPYLAAVTFDDAALTDMRDWMLDWDYQMHMDNPKAALFGEFWMALQTQTFGDQLAGASEILGIILLMEAPANVWWDDANTEDVTETRDDILKRAFSTAIDATTAALGSNRELWQWGDLHTTTFVSNPLGASGISLIEDIVNRGPVATSGSFSTVNAATWRVSAGDFTVRTGSSFRMIVDLSSLDNSISMHTTGQSGHPFSPYYDTLIDSWRNVAYKPMLFSDDQVQMATINTLTLKP